MKRAKLTNVFTGVTVDVHATTNHPCSSYGLPVWVDDDDFGYMQVGLENYEPLYQLHDVVDDDEL